jgi:hypothetical protein
MRCKLTFYKLDCNTAVQCAKTCQELFAHVQPVLWTLVPGLNPARLGRADRYSLVYQITGIEAGEEPSVEAIVGPLRLTQHLSLHFTDEDYQQYPAEIDSNTKEVAQRFPETKHFESLTTTPETTIHTSD